MKWLLEIWRFVIHLTWGVAVNQMFTWDGTCLSLKCCFVYRAFSTKKKMLLQYKGKKYLLLQSYAPTHVSTNASCFSFEFIVFWIEGQFFGQILARSHDITGNSSFLPGISSFFTRKLSFFTTSTALNRREMKITASVLRVAFSSVINCSLRAVPSSLYCGNPIV